MSPEDSSPQSQELSGAPASLEGPLDRGVLKVPGVGASPVILDVWPKPGLTPQRTAMTLNTSKCRRGKGHHSGQWKGCPDALSDDS